MKLVLVNVFDSNSFWNDKKRDWGTVDEATVYTDPLDQRLYHHPGFARFSYLCEGCGEFAKAHKAHMKVWQIGYKWVPVCSDRVLDWWNDNAATAVQERREAGAPDAWIIPL